MFEIRAATPVDREAIRQLIAISARELSRGYYSEEQVSAALKSVYGVDSMLIEDGTYFVAEADDIIVGCGGWSKRKRLFGGDQFSNRDASLLDPRFEAAMIRAFLFTRILRGEELGAQFSIVAKRKLPARDSFRWN